MAPAPANSKPLDRFQPLAQVRSSAQFQPTIVPPRHAVFGSDGQLLSLSSERQKLVCSVLGLTLKLGLVVVTGVSLMRLAVAYQERMERQGELKAVLDLETSKLTKARDRFDQLFAVGGEQGLIREQNQWIAPNRLRVVWQPQH
jgi:hypothetical protein